MSKLKRFENFGEEPSDDYKPATNYDGSFPKTDQDFDNASNGRLFSEEESNSEYQEPTDFIGKFTQLLDENELSQDELKELRDLVSLRLEEDDDYENDDTSDEDNSDYISGYSDEDEFDNGENELDSDDEEDYSQFESLKKFNNFK